MKSAKTSIKNLQKGFTLIELLIVIVIITALAVTVFVALNPVKRTQDARNARRLADIESILTAIHESIVDNAGQLPSNMPAANTEAQLGTAVAGCAIATNGCGAAGAACVDLTSGARNLLTYLKSMPQDPTLAAGSTMTNYTVLVDSNNLVTVRACDKEGAANPNILISR